MRYKLPGLELMKSNYSPVSVQSRLQATDWGNYLVKGIVILSSAFFGIFFGLFAMIKMERWAVIGLLTFLVGILVLLAATIWFLVLIGVIPPFIRAMRKQGQKDLCVK